MHTSGAPVVSDAKGNYRDLFGLHEVASGRRGRRTTTSNFSCGYLWGQLFALFGLITTSTPPHHPAELHHSLSLR